MGEVERQHVEDTAIDQDVFAVIAAQVVRGASHNNSGLQAPQLELAQAGFATAVGEGDPGGHLDASRRRRHQRRLDVCAIEAEDGNLDALLRTLDGREQRSRTVGGFHDQFHDAWTDGAA